MQVLVMHATTPYLKLRQRILNYLAGMVLYVDLSTQSHILSLGSGQVNKVTKSIGNYSWEWF